MYELCEHIDIFHKSYNRKSYGRTDEDLRVNDVSDVSSKSKNNRRNRTIIQFSRLFADSEGDEFVEIVLLL